MRLAAIAINTIGATRVKVAFAHGCFYTFRDETTPSKMAFERADHSFKKAQSINTLMTSSEILRCSLPIPYGALMPQDDGAYILVWSRPDPKQDR